MKKIITISREFGAGGSEIGQKVADRLHFDYYDKAIILRAASKTNMDVGRILEWDEKAPGKFVFTQNFFDFYSKPLNEKLFEAQRDVIREFGEKGNCVIVGRNANTILKEFDNSLHVFIHANMYWRINKLKEDRMKDASKEKISDAIQSVDKARKRYCSYFTNTEFGKADYYDITLNASALGIDRCVDIICQTALDR